MKTSLRILGILLLGLFAISTVGCERKEDPPPTPITPVEPPAPPSHEEQLTGQYQLTRYELNLDGLIFTFQPPTVTGSLVIVEGGSFFARFVDNEGAETVIRSNKWSASATNIILEDDTSVITYTWQGTDLTLNITGPDPEDLSVTLDWEKKA